MNHPILKPPTVNEPSTRENDGRRNGNGHHGPNGHGPDDDDYPDGEFNRAHKRDQLARRNSLWPILLAIGLLVAPVGLILAEPTLSITGGLILVVAVIGWLCEAWVDFWRPSE